VADDNRVPPLPRRAPDGKRHVPGGESGWGSGFTQPLVLPESVRQRIRAALDYGNDEAPPPEHGTPHKERGTPQQERGARQEEHSATGAAAARTASLPRRVPGANNAPEPPAQIARPAMHPSVVHPTPAEPVAAVPAATLGAIAAAAGTPSNVAAGPQPAIARPPEPPLVPAQRPPVEPQPDRHDRHVAGNGARPPAPPDPPDPPAPSALAAPSAPAARSAAPLTRVGMWAFLEQAEAPTGPLPVIPAAGAPAVPAQRAPAEQAPGQPAQRDATTAGPEEETAARDGAPSSPENGQASLGGPRLDGTKGLTRHAGESPPWAPVSPPAMASPKLTPPKSVSPKPVPSQPASAQPGPPAPAPPEPGAPEAPAPSPEPVALPERRRLGRGVKAGVALALVLALAGSLAFLIKRPGGTARAVAPPPGPSASAVPGTVAEVRAAAAAWVASQVSRDRPIACDPVMCRALRAEGVPAADLLVLKPGGNDPLRSRVIVATAAATKLVGTKFLTADAPAAIASFGSGGGQISVRMIFPQGAAAYRAALRQDIADRKANESTLLQNPRVTAVPPARQQLQGGQVDSRLLLTLAQLASQWPLSIVAFGDRGPGASPGVPLRSADLAATGNVADRAGQMAAFAHQLQGYFADARIRVVHLANGQNVVQVAFAAPSPLGELGT
jgi:hypothetical protein